VGVAFSANLLTFIIFYEILTIATYPLVIHKETPESIAGGRKYLVYLLSGGVVLLLALALTYQTAGNADFTAGGILSGEMGHGRVLLLSILFMVGFGVKSAVMPFHSWLPAAMVAPTPVSALLHAVAVVKAGVFGMARAVGFIVGPALLAEIGAADLLAGFAAATILIASLLAFYQDNLKKRLAYSTIGHLSYIVLGTAILSPAAWTGALLHIVTHAVMKITLFFCAGSIYVKTHIQNISELNGIGRQMPLTMAAFALASLGLAGVPPISGFFSKWYLIQGSMDTGQTVFMIVLLISGLLNAGYFIPIVIRAFFVPSDKFKKFDEASWLMVVPLLLTAAISLLIGIFPDSFPDFYELASRVAESVVSGGVR
jgi:multicomponent Na+:H+ antiporter subunit D